MPLYTKQTVHIQPQAKTCMLKENISFDEVLETLNEWESGDVQATNPTEANMLAAYPEMENEKHIPTFREDEKDFLERSIRISVTYSTSFKTHKGKTIKHATVHWVGVQEPLAGYAEAMPQEINWEQPAEWLEPKTKNLN